MPVERKLANFASMVRGRWSNKELFTQGKVSEMRAKFNERRNSKGVNASGGQERSGVVTDDGDDIVC